MESSDGAPQELRGSNTLTFADRAENDEEAPDIASSSERYALRFAGPGGEYLLQRQEQVLKRLLAPAGAAPLRVLDVGGGHMQTATVLARLGHSVAVHGSTAECLVRTRALAREQKGRVESRVGPMFQLPAQDGEFDLVLSIRMLGHVSRWRDLLAELCRASRRFVIVEFASESGAQLFSHVLFRAKRRLEGNTRHYATYNVADVAHEFERLGYRVVAVERQFALPIVLHRVLQRPTLSRAAESLLERVRLTRRMGSPVLLLAERVDTSGNEVTA